ncbi:MAG: alpha/beta hydrolase [Pseudomonadota bacterium]|nr:alpha/beta hydrolase [Pseudomonadota bacterium]
MDANLAGLPPTTIIAAEIGPLRSEGKLLAERLEQAGVEVDYRCYAGVTHEYFGMGLVVKDAAAAQNCVAMAKGASPRLGREARGRAQLMEAKHG